MSNEYTPAFGENMASDKINEIAYQKVKLAFGVDGVATDVSSLNPFPVAASFSASSIEIKSGSSSDLADVTAGKALKVDGSAVTQPVSFSSSPLPTGAATAANQATEIASLSSIDSKLTSPLAVTAASLPLPSGAATSALQGSGNASLASIDGKIVTVDTGAVVVSSSALPSGASTSGNQATANASLASIDSKLTSPLAVTGAFFQATQPVSAVSLPLPTGAATAANQATEIASLASIDTKLTSPLTVTGSVKAAGKGATNLVRLDYSSTNVTTGAYVEILAASGLVASEIFIFDSSGQTLVLAFGAAASEVDQIYIVPGGNGAQPLSVPAGTRLSVKAVSATANAGELDINLFG